MKSIDICLIILSIVFCQIVHINCQEGDHNWELGDQVNKLDKAELVNLMGDADAHEDDDNDDDDGEKDLSTLLKAMATPKAEPKPLTKLAINKLELIRMLKTNRLKINLSPNEVREILDQLGADYHDAELGRIGDLIELDTGANANKCTILDGQHAIRLWHRFRMTQLGTYIDSLRDKQKQICMQVFHKKFEQLPTNLDWLPQEFWDFMSFISDDLILSASDDDAIQLIEEALIDIHEHYKAEDGSFGLMDHSSSKFSREQYLEQLYSGCQVAGKLFGDFVWYRKIINVALNPVEKQWFAYLRACKVLETNDFSYVTNDADLIAEELKTVRAYISKRLNFIKRHRGKLGLTNSRVH